MLTPPKLKAISACGNSGVVLTVLTLFLFRILLRTRIYLNIFVIFTRFSRKLYKFYVIVGYNTCDVSLFVMVISDVSDVCG